MFLVSVGEDIYSIGGQEGSSPDSVINSIYLSKSGAAWEEVGQMSFPRTNCHVVLNGSKLFIFGGNNGLRNGSPFFTTKIEIFDTKDKSLKAASYRLPLGVEGSGLAWQGDRVLLVGGKRMGEPSTGVLLLNFEEKSILSLRYFFFQKKSQCPKMQLHNFTYFF